MPSTTSSSFIALYRPVLKYLFLVGLCPLIVQSKSGHLQCSLLSRCYNAALLFLIIGLTSIIMCHRLSAIFALSDDKLDVHLIASTFELSIVATVYCFVIVESILNGKNHAKFLNQIVIIDGQIERVTPFSIPSFESRSFYNWNMVEMFFLSGFFTVAMIYTNTQIVDPVSYSLNFILYGLFNLMLVSMFSLMQHVRFCARVLCVRHRFLNCRLATALAASVAEENGLQPISVEDILKLLDIFEEVWRLRKHYTDAFQFGLLLNTSFDLVIVIISGFFVWSLLMAFGLSGQLVQIIGSIFGTFLLLPICKCVLLVLAITQMGDEVYFILYNCC